ncbi:MAG: vanadium-dependent haloperoxidase [Pseudomonadota bacterium]|nr:vanadium-dependent haloperoxidase [Pseudomonadota bacterium]
MGRSKPLAALALVLMASSAVRPARADAIADWYVVTQELVRRSAPATDPVAEQVMPLVALAMYDAVVAVDGGYEPYLGRLYAPPNASAAAAAHAAAHAVLLELYPQDQAALNTAYDQAVAAVRDEASRSGGVAIGVRAAHRLMKQRGVIAVEATTSYRPGTKPGRFVPPQLPARGWMSGLRPFVVAEPGAFRTPGPPALHSDEYTRDYEEVLALGGRRDTRRTASQTAIAQFWHSNDLMQLLPQVFSIEGRTLAANARLFALYTSAQFDAGILLARDKYRYDFWRPVTAIRNADQDANASTVRDATWEPLLTTPSHPDYPCGHCLMSALVATIMAAEIGQRPAGGIRMVAADQAPGAGRHYESFDAMAEEVSNSRVWGGVHFRTGARDGAALGIALGRYILENVFVPTPGNADR